MAEQDYDQNDRKSSEYLAQLLSDKKQLQIFPPKMFIHLEKILDDGKWNDNSWHVIYRLQSAIVAF